MFIVNRMFIIFSKKDFIFCRYGEIPDEWEPPKPQPYNDQGNLHYYVMEPDAFDQYVVASGSTLTVKIMLNSSPNPELIMEREVSRCFIFHFFCALILLFIYNIFYFFGLFFKKWSETYTIWSPMGTYLATFHHRGAALWYGEKFDKLRFSHTGVQFMDFSPQEK